MSRVQVPSIIFQTLSEILLAQSPQYAARLKQRLTASLDAKGEPPFDEKKHGFKGFRDFLLHGTQGLFSVSDGGGKDDLVVSLSSAETQTFTVVRGDVWQAFTNPDMSRVRYLNRHTYAIRHFLRGEVSEYSQALAEAPEDFVEIQPISAELQIGWMREFISQEEIEQSHKVMLTELINKEYTSGVNAAFTGALGSLSEKWRQVRFRRVLDFIQEWAKKNELLVDKLSPSKIGDGLYGAAKIQHKPNPPSINADVVGGDKVMAPRDQAIRLLEMLSNNDISRVVIPILLSTLLVRGKE